MFKKMLSILVIFLIISSIGVYGFNYNSDKSEIVRSAPVSTDINIDFNNDDILSNQNDHKLNAGGTFYITENYLIDKIKNNSLNSEIIIDNKMIDDAFQVLSDGFNDNGINSKLRVDVENKKYLECTPTHRSYYKTENDTEIRQDFIFKIPGFCNYVIKEGFNFVYNFNVDLNVDKIESEIILNPPKNGKFNKNIVLTGQIYESNYNKGREHINRSVSSENSIVDIQITGPTGAVTNIQSKTDENGSFKYSSGDNEDSKNIYGGNYHINANLNNERSTGIVKDITLEHQYSVWIGTATEGFLWSKETFNAPNGISIGSKGGIMSFKGLYMLNYYDKDYNFIGTDPGNGYYENIFQGSLEHRLIPANAVYIRYFIDVQGDGHPEWNSGYVPVGNGAIFFEGPINTENIHIKAKDASSNNWALQKDYKKG